MEERQRQSVHRALEVTQPSRKGGLAQSGLLTGSGAVHLKSLVLTQPQAYLMVPTKHMLPPLLVEQHRAQCHSREEQAVGDETQKTSVTGSSMRSCSWSQRHQRRCLLVLNECGP